MCGITGAWSQQQMIPERDFLRMRDAQERRGPDDAGYFSHDGVQLGHRRLSILDLTPSGHQPMLSEDEQHALVFNGEIYNFRDLKIRLEAEGVRFRGTSDTEVLLCALLRWGIERALREANGMFAFAWWSKQEKKLRLARDRFGEKPLFYGQSAGRFVFASSLRSLALAPGFPAELDPGAVTNYLRYGYVPEPVTIYRAARKLPPGCFIELPSPTTPVAVHSYWSMRQAISEARALPALPDAEVEGRLEEALRKSVKMRLESDVPIGAYLSGGLDSSAVVSIANSLCGGKLNTYCIGFRDPGFDEAPYAREVAKALGTRHTELYCEMKDSLALVANLPAAYDEPFADVSQLPTLLISGLARRHVKVALSGDGGDELFGGYSRYGIWKSWRRMHRAFSPAGALLSPLARHLPGRKGTRAGKLREFLRLLNEPSAHLRDKLIMILPDPTAYLLHTDFSSLPWAMDEPFPAGLSPTEEFMALDTALYLPGDILVKVDRASMYHGLEMRTPFLDPEVFQLAWRFTERQREKGGKVKAPLYGLLARKLDPSLVDRPKKGFSVPIHSWLRKELRDWAEALLDPGALARHGVFQVDEVRALWYRHLQGEDAGGPLWSILQLEAWLSAEGRV